MGLFEESLVLLLVLLTAHQAAYLIRMLNLPDRPTYPALFGDNETLLPFLVAPFLAMGVLLFFGITDFAPAITIGLGVVAGEHVCSFFKQLIGMKRSRMLFLDHIGWAMGGSVALWLCFPRVSWEHALLVVVMAYPVHFYGSKLSYWMGWQKTPY